MPKTCHSFIACGERIAQKRSGHLQELVAGTQQPFCIASNFFFLTRLTTLNLEKPDCFFCFFRALSLTVQPRPGSRDICCEHQLALFLYALPGPQTQFPPPTMASFLYALQIHWYCGERRENGDGARCALKHGESGERSCCTFMLVCVHAGDVLSPRKRGQQILYYACAWCV